MILIDLMNGVSSLSGREYMERSLAGKRCTFCSNYCDYRVPNQGQLTKFGTRKVLLLLASGYCTYSTSVFISYRIVIHGTC